MSVSTGPVGAVAVDPVTRAIYLGGAEGLFLSTDGGRSWSLQSRELCYPHTLLVDPFQPFVLYAARRDLGTFLPLPGVYRSEDAGRSWRRWAAGLGEERIFSLALDPRQPGVLYAGSWAGRLYRSGDGGRHWERSSPVSPCSGCAPGVVVQILVHPLEGALYALEAGVGIFRSEDGGANWRLLLRDAGWLAIDPKRGDLYLAGRRFWRSGDGGRSWVDLSAGLPWDARLGVYRSGWVAVNPEPLVLYTREHRSTDGGVTWEALGVEVGFVPRLLVPGEEPVIYGSFNGRAGRYRDTERGTP
ncbi:MAG: WD40/YVTN/BNR-like repeat-containing protein [Anaerolineae bacterium]